MCVYGDNVSCPVYLELYMYISSALSASENFEKEHFGCNSGSYRHLLTGSSIRCIAAVHEIDHASGPVKSAVFPSQNAEHAKSMQSSIMHRGCKEDAK